MIYPEYFGKYFRFYAIFEIFTEFTYRDVSENKNVKYTVKDNKNVFQPKKAERTV